MFRASTFLMICFLVNGPASAEVHFLKVKNQKWQQDTLATMDWVNSKLPQSWPRPKDFNIAYVEGSTPSYYPQYRYKDASGKMQAIPRLLVVGNTEPAILVHEYAHVIFDEMLRQKSIPWQYSIIWQKHKYVNLEERLTFMEEEIPKLQQMRAKFLAKKAAGDISPIVASAVKNTTRTITEYAEARFEIMQALKLQKDYGLPLDGIRSFSALQAYNELFADTLACLVFEDWQIIKKAIANEARNPALLKRLRLPPLDDPETAMQSYLSYRDFTTLWSLQDYGFEDWEHGNPYWQFAPTRTFIRQSVETGQVSPTGMIKGLGLAILDIYENQLLAEPHLVEQGLFEKNLSLQQALRGQIQVYANLQ